LTADALRWQDSGMSDARISTLLSAYDQAYDHPSWHGPNLTTALRGVTAKEALWRPGPGRNTIWDLVLHGAYWKYRVYRWLTPDPPRSFERHGSNFFSLPETADEAAWQQDRDLLESWHRRLRGAIERFDANRLSTASGRREYRFQDLIQGVAAHDLYHAGQIRLIHRLQGA
jgi:hypothetical protein